ncbi:MAG: thioesterase [Thermoleophilia bacterium]|nr:thioesterase [Thermoleophilia bacterium]
MSPKRHRPHVAGPTNAREPFSFSAGTRVAFSDTDAQGIVYYGRYAPYFDVARVEYWRHLGFDPHDERTATDFVMRAFNIEYHAPAKFDDVLEVFTRVARIGSSSLTFEFAVVLADGTDTLLATATQTLVNVDLEAHAPLAIHADVRARVEKLEAAARN